MKTSSAQRLARDLMNQHGLKDWRFEFDRGTNRFGCCHYWPRKITLSRELTEHNDEDSVKDTLLHEVAHALVGPGHNHDSVWRQKALEVGCTGDRCWSPTDTVSVPPKVIGVCPKCGYQVRALRRTRSACRACCDKYNGGVFSYEFAYRWHAITQAERQAHAAKQREVINAKRTPAKTRKSVTSSVKVTKVNDHEYASDTHRFVRGWGDTSERTWTVINAVTGDIADTTYPTLRQAKESI